MITFTVEFTPNGEATIRLPEGKRQQADAGKVADLTDKLSKAIGTVKERHIGAMVNGVHVHLPGETHDHVHEGE